MTFDRLKVNLEDCGLRSGEEGTIYWLSVLASVEAEGDLEPEPLFGWKTADVDSYPPPYTEQHFQDDAVYGTIIRDDSGPVTGPDGLKYGFAADWAELRYPDGHEFAGQSVDMAFVITPEPVTLLVLPLGLIPALLKRRRKA